MPGFISGRTRVASLKAMSEQELRRRRATGEISCAECRRCRIRCDKKVPCGSCTRRGCITLCPNQTLAAGKGVRLVLSDTQQLHSLIVTMSQRIRQLEDALAITTNQHDPNNPHPLLSDNLLSLKFGPEIEAPSVGHVREVSREEDGPDGTLPAMGTFFIDGQGEMNYFGASGGPNALLSASEELVSSYPNDDNLDHPSPPPLPFSFNGDNHKEVFDALEEFLPHRSRALSLCQIYLERYSWYFRPLSRDELINDVLTPIYTQTRFWCATTLELSQRRPHRLAVLFFIFAVGSSMDLHLPAYSSEANNYYRLGKAALSLQPILDSPQMETVQAVSLAAAYDCNSGMKRSSESSWSCIALAMKLATRLGLHRDPSRWAGHLKNIDRRRRLFWEIYYIDVTQSLVFGRPQTISLLHVDCKFPEDEEPVVDEAGQTRSDFWTLKYTFARDLFSVVLDNLLSGKPSDYKTILELDQKIRDMTPPATFKSGVNVNHNTTYTQIQPMQYYVASQYRFFTMLVVHRSSFASALLENATNPLATRYAPSVLAINRCASLLIQSLTVQFEQCFDVCIRMQYPWAAGFSSAMVAGSIVIQSPTSSLAGGALVDLNAGVELFKKAAACCCRYAVVALPFLCRLKERAQLAYTRVQNKDTRLIYLDVGFIAQPTETIEQDDNEQDLATFGGYTKVVSSRQSAHVWNSTASAPIAFEPLQKPAVYPQSGSQISPAIHTDFPASQVTATDNPRTPNGHIFKCMAPEIHYPPQLNGNEYQTMDMEYFGAVMPDSAEQWWSFLLSVGILESSALSEATDEITLDQGRWKA